MVSAILCGVSQASYQQYATRYFHISAEQIVNPSLYQIPVLKNNDIIQLSIERETLTLTIDNKTEFEIPFYRTVGPQTFLEAKKDGQWKPIEYWFFSSCGNAVDYGLLKPGVSVSTKTTLFPGSFQTEIRAGMFLCNGTFTYSKPVYASIHENMFVRSPHRFSGLGQP